MSYLGPGSYKVRWISSQASTLQRIIMFSRVYLPVIKTLHMFKRNFLYFNLWPLPFVLSLGSTVKNLAFLSCHMPFPTLRKYWYNEQDPQEPSLPQAEHSQPSQPFFVCQMFQTLSDLHGALLDLLSMSTSLLCSSPGLDPAFQLSHLCCAVLCWHAGNTS